MLTLWTVGLLVIGYLIVLFLIAFWGDKNLQDNQQHPILYSLGLGVHCTSWAFFGTITQASQYGWAVVPTYSGIILTMLFGFGVMRKVSRLCQQHNVSSLADLIGLQYRNSHLLAAIVTLLCFVGVVPYIALQLDAITESINLITGSSKTLNTVGFYVAAIMALFAVLFGTRTLNLTRKHPGLLLTIAVESIIKLAALSIVGIFVCYSLFDGVFDLFAQASKSAEGQKVLFADAAPWVYLSHMLLGVCSMFVLPRQFHMNFIEQNGDSELRKARWLFPLYLIGMTIFILPIALAGQLLLDTNTIKTDAFVLALPIHSNETVISIIAFLGGISAATSMVIVATLALGVMMANNLFTPVWLKLAFNRTNHASMQTSSLLTIRRLTIIAVLSVAYWYHINISQSAPLGKTGSIAIALLAQIFPIMMFGLYWQKSTRLAAQCALIAGFACWIMWLLYPSLLSSYYFNPPLSDAELANGFIFSLLVNCIVFVSVSFLLPQRAMLKQNRPESSPLPELAIRIKDLLQLTQKVLEPATNSLFLKQLNYSTLTNSTSGYASHSLLMRVEKLLTVQVGNPSARILLTAIADSQQETIPDLVEWVEEASQSFQFNHEVLQSSVQNIEQGICVLNQQLCLLAWNPRYVQLFNYPKGYLQVGMPIQSLLQFNAERGLLAAGCDVEAEIDKRVNYMRSGSRYKHVRKHNNGKVIELNGHPLPAGGYVTTYSDITEYIQIQDELEAAKNELERRVQQRTLELHQARLEADKANQSKTRFLAAAGHDLMQPFNAATLFASMLAQKTSGSETEHIAEGLVSSLNSAECLLTTLLDMTKLESGVLTTAVSEFSLDEIFEPLVSEFSIIAQQKLLRLRYVQTQVRVRSDKNLLRRIVQNLISNAIRYTKSGGILLGVRRQDNTAINICVIDTGPGIAKHQQREIFNEFHQLEGGETNQGLGLGLTIVERISQLLGHHVSLQSTVDIGTQFTVTVPRVSSPIYPITEKPGNKEVSLNRQPLIHCTVLVLENDVQIVSAMTTLLGDWGAQVIAASSLAQALARCPTPPALMLVDYHLDHGEVGTDAVLQLRAHWEKEVKGILITANRNEGIRDEAESAHLCYLPKPIKSIALKRMIKQLLNEDLKVYGDN
ncbi:PAS domain-containing hybrid sensor histidine kinase/response regulator [Alteromonas sp. ASW11-130]|uniref:PAS domain-containing hybrid sensor histidine kinase/response regulator n=1 Tax=Alteromonas sp. ASW11-130 TaxID=3015775 RepID=UPI002242AE5C|nr:PAS-domain containing protein [Alteromonas sp. ASW11-130]MCW8091432.1 PAS-domain containing protein [Alteromonas sp. ASW11-130]